MFSLATLAVAAEPMSKTRVYYETTVDNAASTLISAYLALPSYYGKIGFLTCSLLPSWKMLSINDCGQAKGGELLVTMALAIIPDRGTISLLQHLDCI